MKARVGRPVDLAGLAFERALAGHQGGTTCIAWSPLGDSLASVGQDRALRFWSPDSCDPFRTIKRHEAAIWAVAWSSDAQMIASASDDLSIRVWNPRSSHFIFSIGTPSGPANCLAWCPTSPLLAFGTWNEIAVWDMEHGERLWTRDATAVNSAAWSPKGRFVASAGNDQQITIWDGRTGSHVRRILAHKEPINAISWSPDGHVIVSGSDDRTIRIWDAATGREVARLEGHTGAVRSVAFSPGGSVLVSRSADAGVRLWRTDTWEQVGRTPGKDADTSSLVSLAFHPKRDLLATLADGETSIHLWEVDLTDLKAVPSSSVHYTNAKIVLVGDSGVGKSGLSLVLSGQSWVETGSTHARKVWNFSRDEVKLADGRTETREALLWDLAGQPNYRIIHQLQLTEVTVALVVFDSRSPTDPFVGVKHWVRALRQAQRAQGDEACPIRKYLVAARIDVGRIGVSQARIEAMVSDLGFDGYFETSSREGWGGQELAVALRHAIGWETLPKVSSTRLFTTIKDYLISEKEKGRILSNLNDLFSSFEALCPVIEPDENLRAQFDTCIRLVESRGLIRKLSYGHLILLQPEKIDSYASAIADAAKAEPDGMGCVAEETVLLGQFLIPEDERLLDRNQESLLLPATIAHLVKHELALREQTDEGPHLVFPSQLTREIPDLQDSEGKTVIFTFDGPVLNIYATLVVRLSHSGVFLKREMWKNAASFTARVGGLCGLILREVEEGTGEMTLFFDSAASEETRFQFEEYVRTHLQRRALPERLVRRRMFVCDSCNTPVSDVVAMRRLERGTNWLECPVCDQRISLLDREQRLPGLPKGVEMEIDKAANIQRERDIAIAVLPGKEAVGDFDVFLCHNSIDKPVVRGVAERLRSRGVLPWLDERELRPGLPWQRALEGQIEKTKAAAVFVGADGLGPWHQQEIDALLREFVKRGCPVIPVLLPNAPQSPELPLFLRGMMWVDLRKAFPDPFDQLIFGITGERQALG